MLENVPIIIGLDCSHSEIRDYDVEAAILGTQQVRFNIDTTTKQLVSQELIRKKDSGISLAPGSEMISAVIWSKGSVLTKSDTIKLAGEIFENPKARNRLTASELNKIDFHPVAQILIDL